MTFIQLNFRQQDADLVLEYGGSTQATWLNEPKKGQALYASWEEDDFELFVAILPMADVENSLREDLLARWLLTHASPEARTLYAQVLAEDVTDEDEEQDDDE